MYLRMNFQAPDSFLSIQNWKFLDCRFVLLTYEIIYAEFQHESVTITLHCDLNDIETYSFSKIVQIIIHWTQI